MGMDLFNAMSGPRRLTKLAVGNYRSLLSFVTPLDSLNVITGVNGSGKSNLYRALRLLAATARGGVSESLAREGGLYSAFWAGPEQITEGMRTGRHEVQGGPRRKRKRLRLGFGGTQFGYSISFGLPKPDESSLFSLDPEIKRETIWAGDQYHPAKLLLDREGALVRCRGDRGWRMLREDLSRFVSIFDQVADPAFAPEVFLLREEIRRWRFYDQFRSDALAPARSPMIGTRTPVLHHDGRDLPAALQTIREGGDAEALAASVRDAFPGAEVAIVPQPSGHFLLQFHQHGLLRPLTAAELSDGTLRYLLWIAALLTPEPPSLMVLNEPENSLHPELLPALARLIADTATRTQVWVVTHSERLVMELESGAACRKIRLHKILGMTESADQNSNVLERPAWRWPDNV